MANSLSQALKTGHKVFHQRIANFQPWWKVLTDPIMTKDPQYKESLVYGITTYSAVSDTPTPIEIFADGSTTAIAAFEEIAKVSLKESRDNPKLITNTYLNLGNAWHLTLSRAIKTGIAALDTTVHPLNGASNGVVTAQGGGNAYVCDDFTITPPNVAAFNQSNLLSSGFGATAVSAALANRWEYLDYSGNETMTGEMDEDKPYLIAPAELATEATDLYERKGEVYDGAGLQSGSFNARLRAAPVTLPGATTDANDWFLWWKKTIVDEDGKSGQYGPFAPVIRVSPRVTVFESPDSHHIFIKAYGEYALHYFADADQRVIMSKVA